MLRRLTTQRSGSASAHGALAARALASRLYAQSASSIDAAINGSGSGAPSAPLLTAEVGRDEQGTKLQLLVHVRHSLSGGSTPLVLSALPTSLLPASRAEALGMLGRLNAAGGGKDGKGGGKDDDGDKTGGAGGDGSVPPIDDESNFEQWLVPRTVLFVLVIFLITLALYRLARPSGRHVGWASLKEHAGAIREIALYSGYAQVYLDNDKVYLGLVHDHDTQRHIDELADSYAAAVQAAKVEAAAEDAVVLAAVAATTTPPPPTAEATTEGEDSMKQEEAPVTPAAAATAPLTTKEREKERSAIAKKPDELQVSMRGTPAAETALAAVGVFAWIVPFIFFPVFVMFLSQYIGKSMTYAVDATKTKSKVKDMLFKIETTSTTKFRDIAGMKEPKKEITEIVDFLRHPERYTRLGAKIPTGALLLGPPGTGKTLLAKAVAGESGVGFIPVCGSDFVELYVGMGALRVRQLFKEARKQRCIVYIDEIDAIGLKRQGAGHGEKQEQEQTLNQLLTELDGFGTGKRGEIMVLASSNVGQEQLDPALIRPGRFDRIIHVDTPVISERVDIFKVHLSKLKLVATAEEEAAAAKAREAGQQAEDTMGANNDRGHVVRLADGELATETAATEEGADTTDKAEGSDTKVKADATASPASTAVAQPEQPINTTETQITLSSLEAEKASDAAIKAQETEGHFSFDFRSLLVNRTDQERALIDFYSTRMSNLCPGFVGADIANVCNEGAILAAREGSAHVGIGHLERSIDRVLAGIEHRSRVLSPFEKNVVAHHEAGHAVAGWFLNRADPLMKVSIVPRGGSALGYAQYLPNENLTRTAKEIRDSIAVTLGGRVAEEIFFNHLSTGASDDLRKVGQMAYMYVSSFAPGSVYPAPGTSATRLMKPFGANRANAFDECAKTLVDEVYKETYALLLAHRADMERLAQHLLTHEMLTFQDVVSYLGEREKRISDKRKGV